MPVGVDKVHICNLAISLVGSTGFIEALTESSKAAGLCKKWYDTARLATLEAFNWSFAKKSQVLALHAADAPTSRWAFRYQLPADCVAARLLENPAGPDADAVPYEVENAGDGTLSLVTDLEDATLLYTCDLKTEALFSTYFVLMLATQLGVFIAAPLTGKFGIMDRLQKSFALLQQSAPAADAATRIARAEPDAPAIAARA